MALVPTVLFGALQGIATLAKTNNDTDAMSLCTQIAELASFGFGSPSYFAATTSTTGPLVQEFYPAGSVTPSYDTSIQGPTPPGTPGTPW
jgi:hypothetical protein